MDAQKDRLMLERITAIRHRLEAFSEPEFVNGFFFQKQPKVYILCLNQSESEDMEQRINWGIPNKFVKILVWDICDPEALRGQVIITNNALVELLKQMMDIFIRESDRRRELALQKSALESTLDKLKERGKYDE